jgi:hypothetical protein
MLTLRANNLPETRNRQYEKQTTGDDVRRGAGGIPRLRIELRTTE